MPVSGIYLLFSMGLGGSLHIVRAKDEWIYIGFALILGLIKAVIIEN